ncbi:MAG: EamA family transporter [Propionibacteriaceae bacterium]|nr:EamA family transporter [Propionibacteriaceae bacterium]
MRRPVVLVLIAIASVQFGAAIAKSIFDSAHPVTLAFLRAFIAALIFLAISRPRLRGRTGRDWLLVIAYGLSLSGMNMLIYLSFQRIPIGLAVTLEFVGPLALAVLGSRRLIDLVWVCLAAAGVVILGVGPSELDIPGVLLALGAGALWACYIALAGPIGRRWEGMSGLVVGSFIGAAALAVPGSLVADGAFTHLTVLGVMAAVALLSTVIPYALELQARRSMKAATFSILMSLEPAAAALFAWIVLGEWLQWPEWVAMACVVIASIGAIRSAPTTVSPPQAAQWGRHTDHA